MIANCGDWDCTYRYWWDESWRLLEERNGSGQTLKQQLWGLSRLPVGIDELLQVAVNANPSQDANCESLYYPLQNANFNVIGLTDAAGMLVERYEYTPGVHPAVGGQRTVFKKAGSSDVLTTAPLLHSQPVLADGQAAPYGQCDFGHQGLQHDKEFGWDYNRFRYRDPLGRWPQRDFRKYPDGMNAYQYVSSAPVRDTDPTGLSPEAGAWALGLYDEDGPWARHADKNRCTYPTWSQADFEKIEALCNCFCLGFTSTPPSETDDAQMGIMFDDCREQARDIYTEYIELLRTKWNEPASQKVFPIPSGWSVGHYHGGYHCYTWQAMTYDALERFSHHSRGDGKYFAVDMVGHEGTSWSGSKQAEHNWVAISVGKRDKLEFSRGWQCTVHLDPWRDQCGGVYTPAERDQLGTTYGANRLYTGWAESTRELSSIRLDAGGRSTDTEFTVKQPKCAIPTGTSPVAGAGAGGGW